LLQMAALRVPLRLLSLDVRMPWLSGGLSLVQYHLVNGPGKVCGTNGRLDR